MLVGCSTARQWDIFSHVRKIAKSNY